MNSALAGKVDAVATDTQEAPGWLEQAQSHPKSLRLWGPFTRDSKAYLARPDREALSRDLDDWLQEREADGTLASLRTTHLKGAQPAVAAGLPALIGGVVGVLGLAATFRDRY